MTFYIAITALLNLGLGYALAVFMGAGRTQAAYATGEPTSADEYVEAA
jgi:hypothetical protein